MQTKKDIIKKAAAKFLQWKLPADFSPDCGISFSAEHSHESSFGVQRHEPVGTNLLTYEQAEKMLEFCLQELDLEGSN
jgi:hypothetical protein